jgi:hypothetical protein
MEGPVLLRVDGRQTYCAGTGVLVKVTYDCYRTEHCLLEHSHTCEERQIASSWLSVRSLCQIVCSACTGRIFFKFDI